MRCRILGFCIYNVFTSTILGTNKMLNSDALDLEVNISLSSDQTNEGLDDLTRSLYIELQDFNLEKLELKQGITLPKGAKSGADPITIGAIAITVLPSLLPKVIEFIQAWSMRGDKKIVKFKGKISGQVIEFEGSREDLEKIISQIKKPR